MLVGQTANVADHLAHICLFPPTEMIAKCTPLPNALVDRVCLFAGNCTKTNILNELAHWTNPNLGTCVAPKTSLFHEQVFESARLLARARPTRLVRGSIYLYAYAKLSANLHDESKRVDMRCPDDEWEYILNNIMREFHPTDTERKLVVRRGEWGRVYMYGSGEIRLECYTPEAKAWTLMSHLPLATLRLMPQNEKASLIRKLIRCSITTNCHERHAKHQLGRIAQHESHAFQTYVKKIARFGKRKTVDERRLIRRVISPKFIVGQMLKIFDELKDKTATIEQSMLIDIYNLNKIRVAKYPRDLMRTLFNSCQHKFVPNGIIKMVYKKLVAATGAPVTLRGLHYPGLTPCAFDLAVELNGLPPKFDVWDTTQITSSNTSLFTHLVMTDRFDLLSFDFEKMQHSIAYGISRDTTTVVKAGVSASEKAKAIVRVKALRRLFDSLFEKYI